MIPVPAGVWDAVFQQAGWSVKTTTRDVLAEWADYHTRALAGVERQLTVHSAHRPAIYTDISGTRRIAAGTIHKITMGTATARLPFVVPEGITLAEIAWEQYPPKAPVKATSVLGRWESRFVTGSAGKAYTVQRDIRGSLSCTCPGYTYRRHCKHLAIAFPELR